MGAQTIDFLESRGTGAAMQYRLENRDCFTAQAAPIRRSECPQFPVNVFWKFFDQ
jgi:hypothetical protein